MDKLDGLSGMPVISVMIFLPVAGAFILKFLRSTQTKMLVCLAITSTVLLLALLIPLVLTQTPTELRWEETAPWISSIGATYHVSIDNLNIWFVILTALTGLVSICYAWRIEHADSDRHYISLLLMLASTIGIFCATDTFLFIVFWGMGLALPYFLQGCSTGLRKGTAAGRIFLFQFSGLMLLMIAFVSLYLTHIQIGGFASFDWQKFAQISLPVQTQRWIFWLFALAFSIRMPIFPFHGWLSETISESPASLSMFLLGVGIKTGAYGFLRFTIPLCPDATLEYAPIMVYFALISIIYGALLALVQPDMKKRMAFSCLSHMGFILIGIFVLNTLGFKGTILHILNHGISFLALFAIIDWLCIQYGSSLIHDYGGYWKKIPMISVMFLIASLSYFGLPGLNGFPGLFLILAGVTRNQMIWSFICIFGFAIGVTYILWMFQSIFLGKETSFSDRSTGENMKNLSVLIVPLILLILFLGLYPQILLKPIDHTTNEMERALKSHQLLHWQDLEEDKNLDPLEQFLKQYSKKPPQFGDKK